ncbi:Translation initiation factor IF-3 [Porphyridium purpureum]|uniref:Translation initiation factor IF-3 n=1 Tax=Porphyridium purpureum TaxID=35688 RepID=A0A5J4Z8N6_PORPP|nr:Translation initiation factor IF-3 [Porphyridium purpureum]|eukprot:POR2716..scf295_1
MFCGQRAHWLLWRLRARIRAYGIADVVAHRPTGAVAPRLDRGIAGIACQAPWEWTRPCGTRMSVLLDGIKMPKRALGSSLLARSGKTPGGSPSYRVNEEIPAHQTVRLVKLDGTTETMQAENALQAAKSEGLDLVEIAASADLPVCKLLKYDEFVSAERRKTKEVAKKARAASKQAAPKEIRLGPATEQHDFDIKMKKVIQFLEEGRRVRVFVQFRKGQGNLQESALNNLQKAGTLLESHGVIERMTTIEDQRKKDAECDRMGVPRKPVPMELFVKPSKSKPEK